MNKLENEAPNPKCVVTFERRQTDLREGCVRVRKA